MRTRIAPTPSGLLHAGNAMNFLLVVELARRTGARLLLRIDDLDQARVRAIFLADVFRVLDVLGIHWDEGPRDAEDFVAHWSQQRRIHRYEVVLGRLISAGATFACTCTRRSIRDCRCAECDMPADTAGTVLRLRTRGAAPVIVHCLDGRSAELDPHALIPEPVLRQRNGAPAYQVASLSDDVDMAVDLIVRGEDLLPSTAAQLHMARVLGLTTFQEARFVHHPLHTDAEGRKLSKSRPDVDRGPLMPTATELAEWRAWARAQADAALDGAGIRP